MAFIYIQMFDDTQFVPDVNITILLPVRLAVLGY